MPRTVTISRRWVIPALAGAGALMLITAGAAAAVETDTVPTLGRGLWWSLALMTTVGFIGGPPQTLLGEGISAVLMVSGFFLLALVSAALASLFVREDEQDLEAREGAAYQVLLEEVRALRAQVAQVQGRLDGPSEPPREAGHGA